MLAIKQCSQDLKGLIWKCLFCCLGPRKKNQQHTQPTDDVDLHTIPPPTPQPWFEHRPQWWKTSALRTVPFETENYLTKHEVVLFLFRYHYLLQKVCCGTMVSKVSSAYNCYPLTIPNKYSGKFRFSSNKDFYCRVNFYWHCALIIFWKSVMS